MPRPKLEHPTPGELEVLKILWDEGPATGRDVMERLNRDGKPRAYTTVTSLLNVMADKGLATRKEQGRAFTYAARVRRDKTLTSMLRDLVTRAFEGSTSALVATLLDDKKLTPKELEQVRRILDEHADK